MVSHKARHRAEQDFADRGTEVAGHLKQDFAVSRGNRAHKIHGVTLVIILRHVALKETPELPCDGVMDITIVQVLAQEERVSAQIAGRGGIMIARCGRRRGPAWN